MTEYEENGEDRISKLSISLLHEILSRISIKDVARTCVLSKQWNNIWETFPFFNFDKEFYFSIKGNKNNRFSKAEAHWKNEQLMKKAKQMVLSRCQEEDSTLLKLHWVIPEDKSWVNPSLQFLRNLAKTGLQELSIVNNYGSLSEEEQEYVDYLYLPSLLIIPSPLILPNSIRKLYFYRLEGFKGFKSLLSCDVVKFNYLTTIELDNVVMVDDGALNGLNLLCPSLESLTILNCSGFENLWLTRLPKLKIIVLMRSTLKILKIESSPCIDILRIKFNRNFSRVDITDTNIKVLSIQCNEDLSEVDIINTNIEILCIKFNEHLVRLDIINMNVDSVRELKLSGDFLTQHLFKEFICKCRFLKFLGISNTKNLNTINISMETIEVILIMFVEKLVKVEMTVPTPMLKEFKLLISIHTNPPIILWNFPKPKFDVFVVLVTNGMDDDWDEYIPDDDKLQIWQDFFGYFSNAEKLMLLCPPQFLFWVKRKGSISLLPSLKYIKYVNALPDSSAPILHLLESLIFLAPQATTISFKNNANIINSVGSNLISILKINYGEKEDGETTSSEFLGIEAWLLSVSQVIVEKYNGSEYAWKELIKIVSKFENVDFVLPKTKYVKFFY